MPRIMGSAAYNIPWSMPRSNEISKRKKVHALLLPSISGGKLNTNKSLAPLYVNMHNFVRWGTVENVYLLSYSECKKLA